MVRPTERLARKEQEQEMTQKSATAKGIIGNNKTGWYCVDGYATSQRFPSRAKAEAALAKEAEEMKRMGLDPDGLASAGIIKWTY